MRKTKKWYACNFNDTVRIYLPMLGRKYRRAVKILNELTVCETACNIAREHGKINCKKGCPFERML